MTASTVYVSRLKAALDERAQAAEREATRHYQNVLDQIESEVLREGVSPADARVNQIVVASPEDRVKVQLNWRPLTRKWLTNKAYRAGRGYRYNPNRNTSGVFDGRAPRGRSIGPNTFWLDEGKLARAFRSTVLGKGKARARYEMKEMANGDYEVRFVIEFDKLPARYLDLAIRRSLIDGATGVGRLGGLVDLPTSVLPAGNRARGVYRGAWPEYHRPMMRPIAQRLGRELQKQIIKSLNRR